MAAPTNNNKMLQAIREGRYDDDLYHWLVSQSTQSTQSTTTTTTQSTQSQSTQSTQSQSTQSTTQSQSSTQWLYQAHPTSGWTTLHHAVRLPPRHWQPVMVLLLRDNNNHHINQSSRLRTQLGQSVLDVLIATHLGLLPYYPPSHDLLIETVEDSRLSLRLLALACQSWTVEMVTNHHETVVWLPRPLQSLQQFLWRLYQVCVWSLSVAHNHKNNEHHVDIRMDTPGTTKTIFMISMENKQTNPFELMLFGLAHNGDCPSALLVRLLVALSSSSGHNDDDDDARLTPLDVWASAPQMTPHQTLLEPLLRQFRGSHEKTTLLSHRTVLERAMASGTKSWSEIQRLVQAHPPTVLRLPLCAVTTSALLELDDHCRYRAHQRAGGKLGLVVPCTAQDYQAVRDQVHLEQLTIWYWLIRQHPQLIMVQTRD